MILKRVAKITSTAIATCSIALAGFSVNFEQGKLAFNPNLSAEATALLTRQNVQYFRDRPQFYGTSGNGYASAGYGSSLLRTNSYGKEGNCTWYAFGRLKELGFNPSDIMTGYPNANRWTPLRNGATAISNTSTPRVGDVAQWHLNGANHVAIVEKVERDYIYISEAHWTSNYDGDLDRDGILNDGTLHHVRRILKTNPHRYLRLNGGSTSNLLSFTNGYSRPSITTSVVNYYISASNLSGKKVYVQMWRNAVSGSAAREWNYVQTATTNEITFTDLDGTGNTLAGVDYYLVTSLNPIASGEAAKRRTSCGVATGSQQLCDVIRR